jgi:hypothetical protein
VEDAVDSAELETVLREVEALDGQAARVLLLSAGS